MLALQFRVEQGLSWNTEDALGVLALQFRVEQAIHLARLNGLDPRLCVSDGAHLGVWSPRFVGSLRWA